MSDAYDWATNQATLPTSKGGNCETEKDSEWPDEEIPSYITDPRDDHSCDPLRGKRMDSADVELDQQATANEIESVLEASRKCRQNDLLLFDAMRKAGCL